MTNSTKKDLTSHQKHDMPNNMSTLTIRSATEEKRKTGRPKTFHPAYWEIMRRLFYREKKEDIAKALGLSVSRLSVIVNSPIFKAEQVKIEREIKEQFVKRVANAEEMIRNHAQKAATNVIEIADQKEDIRAGLIASTSILKMSGITEKEDSAPKKVSFDTETIAAIKEAFASQEVLRK